MDNRVFFKMPFCPCPSGCGRFLSADDGHDRCLQCLGRPLPAPSAATRADLSGSSRGSPADALGDLRVTVRASPPGTPPRTSYSSRSEHPVRFPGDFAGLSHGAPSISFGVPSVDRMSIAASGDGFTSSEDEGAVGLPPSGVVATAAPDPELTAMLARAAVSIGLEVNRPPSPEPSRLDDWFLGAGRGSQPSHRLLCHPPLLPFAAPPQVRRLCRWSRLHSVWRRGSRCPACLAGSRAQFDSATRFSSLGDLPSSTAFSRRRWQSGTPLSCARRLLSSWQRMQSSRSLQPR